MGQGLIEILGIRPGVSAMIGSGGKTTLLEALAREAPGTVCLATTTRFLPFPGIRTFDDPHEAAASGARTVCVARAAERGKLAEPPCGIEALAQLFDFVLIEADGSRGLPLKAHAPHEPVIPENSKRTVLVVGASGLMRPIREAVHRPELFCKLAGCTSEGTATPERVARVINAEALADVVVVNQCEHARKRELAHSLATHLDLPAFGGSVREERLERLN